MAQDDPFCHHPALRALVTPPEESRFYQFRVEMVLDMLRDHGLSPDWILSEAVREADRARTLAGRMGADLWVFGYGSLMWDPGVQFAEVRRAHVADVARRFILLDTEGGRGTSDNPGVMAALDQGPGCHGLVFRIPAAVLEAETYSLWSRERIGPAYLSAFVMAQTAHGPVEALTFLADHDADMIQADLSHDAQVHYCANGAGFLGTSRAYLENLVQHLEVLRIDDPEIDRLMRDVRAFDQG